MEFDKQYLVLAYYLFTKIEDPHAEVIRHKEFFTGRDVSGRIYLSEEGINGQMSGSREDAKAYMDWMAEHPIFSSVRFKIHLYHENVFPRMTVKYRKQLVALDRPVDYSQTGGYLSPKEWKARLENRDPNLLLLDVRNQYEWEVGHFEGASCPPCETFREFAEYAEQLAQEREDKSQPIMMCCTGGIRCELYSAFLKEKGFSQVYQLEGGIINYGLQEGSDHWKGKLFVFDDRLVVPIAEGEETETIGRCRFCSSPIDHYYNCANMDCNDLFLCCPDCLKEYRGCCQESCQEMPRLRPYHQQNRHKPFRKWYHYFSSSNPAKQIL